MLEFSSGINKLALKNFYETYKKEYFKRRNSGDKKLWDEQYKWDILPALNQKLSTFDKITKENASLVLGGLLKNNPSQGSFTYWTELENMKSFITKSYSYNILDFVWQSSSGIVGENINTANNFSKNLSSELKFGPATWGYLLSSKDCSQFALYHDNIMQELVEINSINKLSDAGDKYQLLNDSALCLGGLIQKDKGHDGTYSQVALNGQDFLWVVIQYIRTKVT